MSDECLFPFDILGFKNDPMTAVYRRRDNCEIIQLPFKNHGMSDLLALAPAEFWWQMYPEKNGKFNCFQAFCVLSQLAIQAGKFNPERTRGYGAWIDNERIIYNDGKTLSGDPIETYKTDYYYYYGEKITQQNEPKLLPDLINVFELLGFKPQDKMLLLGWCVIAPICGALTWRPHIWITANHGSGKSTILERIIKPLIGKCVFSVSGSTEAGIRQELKNNSFPVMFDEAEGNTNHSRSNMSRVIELARHSSGNMSGQTQKGTPTGKAFNYTIQSMFCFSSINPPIESAADESRIKEMEYTKLGNDTWVELSNKITEIITKDNCSSFRNNTINNIKNVLQSINVVKNIILSQFPSNARMADQFSPMIAGYWHVKKNDVIDSENALTIIDIIFKSIESDISDVQENILSDTEQCLNDILTIGIPCGGGKIESLRYIILSAVEPSDEFLDRDKEKIKTLNMYGISISRNLKYVLIHERNTEFRKLLEKTPWKTGVSKVLKRYKNIVLNYSTCINGANCKTIRIPIDTIKGSEIEEK